jgi:hypothetical protein
MRPDPGSKLKPVDQAAAERLTYELRKVVHDAKQGRRGPKSNLPDDDPEPSRQSNLTDPDIALMRRSEAHEYRQAYNAQAVVCADGAQLILATNPVATSADAPSFAAPLLAMQQGIGLPTTVLADTSYASAAAVAALEEVGIEPLVAIGRTQSHRPYDFRPLPEPKTPRQMAARAQNAAPDERTLAGRHEGQAGNGRCQSQIQKAQRDGGTCLWHHQSRDVLHPLPPAWPQRLSENAHETRDG